MDILPTEVWSKILESACADTGYTARSLSETCSYFNAISKPFKWRSLAIQGVLCLDRFLRMTEDLPVDQRPIENLYLCLYSPRVSDEDQEIETSDGFQTMKRRLANTFSQNQDMLDALQETWVKPSEELRIHLILRILEIHSATLKYLYVSFAQVDRAILLPPIHLPLLEELVVSGRLIVHTRAHNVGLAFLERLPPATALRRLRLADIMYECEHTLQPLLHYAPHITHLRLDTPNAYSGFFLSSIKTLLVPPESESEGSESEEESTESLEPPSFEDLERVLIHPGSDPAREGRTTRALPLREFVDDNPRICLYPPSRFGQASKYFHAEGLEEWLDRINGKEAYWEDPEESERSLSPR